MRKREVGFNGLSVTCVISNTIHGAHLFLIEPRGKLSNEPWCLSIAIEVISTACTVATYVDEELLFSFVAIGYAYALIGKESFDAFTKCAERFVKVVALRFRVASDTDA